MADRPYTLLSCGVSIDGYLGSASPQRLRLSNDADFDRVDGVRASCDAILVGAATVRNDDPRLLVRSPARQQERLALGRTRHPTKVTVTASGNLPAHAAFFRGDSDKVVYCSSGAVRTVERQCRGQATVVSLGTTVHMAALSEHLQARGVQRLMVEGGGTVHTQFLTGDLVDELQLV